MTFDQLLATGWTPPADDLHDSLFAPELGESPDEMRGTFEGDRAPGYERSR